MLRSRHLGLAAVAALLTAALGSLAACAGTAPRQVPGSAVVQVPLAWSNAYLVLGDRPILVDAGSDSDADHAALGEALTGHGLGWADLALIVLTHAHADHAGGGARAAEASGAPILLGAADTVLAASGRTDHLPTMGVEARMVRPFVPKRFTPFVPGRVVADRPVDLRPFGVAGRVVPAPGHTPGSVVVRLDDGEALVGDLFRGGVMGGRLRPGTPHTHYFHEDRARAEAVVVDLLSGGVTRFYLGHGGPVTAEAAAARFAPTSANALAAGAR